jgi:hypothetical protein
LRTGNNGFSLRTSNTCFTLRTGNSYFTLRTSRTLNSNITLRTLRSCFRSEPRSHGMLGMPCRKAVKVWGRVQQLYEH